MTNSTEPACFCIEIKLFFIYYESIYYNILNIFINQIKYRNKIILFTGIYPVLNTLIQFQLLQLLTMRYCNYHLKPI